MGESARSIFHPDDAERWKASAGKPYRPSNGTEGEIFEEAWCENCRRDAAFRADGEKNSHACCSILLNVHAYAVTDPEYPKEWVIGEDGQPKCSAFSDKHAPRPAYRCKRTEDLFAQTTGAAEQGRAGA